MRKLKELLDDKVFSGIIVVLDNKSNIIDANNEFLSLLGFTFEDIDNKHITDLIVPDEKSLFLDLVFVQDISKTINLKFYHKSGAFRSFSFSIVNFENYKILFGNTYHIVGVKDITEQQMVIKQYHAEKKYLNRALESIKEGVIICNINNVITLFNSKASQISGIKAANAIDKNIIDTIKVIDNNDKLVDYLTTEDFKNDDVLILSKDGLFRHVSVSVSNISDTEGESQGKVMAIVDISEAKKREKEILYLSYHDILTGVYNRTYLDFEIKRLDTPRQLPFAVIIGDVNGLKNTNDVSGHKAGDKLLKKVAEVLKHSCRVEDIIGRWGGDEFLVLLPNTTNEEAHTVLRRIMKDFENLNQKDTINGVLPNISLGYGVKTSEDEDIYETLKIAESNRYKRKMLSNKSIHS